MSKRQWLPGDPVVNFVARSTNNPTFHFGSAAGRYLVLCFFGSASIEKNRQALEFMTSKRDFFNDSIGSFFGVSIDKRDEAENRVRQSLPGIRYFWDFDQKVSKLYGAIAEDHSNDEAQVDFSSFTLVIDPMLRVLAYIPLKNLEEHNKAFEFVISSLPDVKMHAGVPMQAPVLILPRIFEPEFCKELIALYEQNGGYESGFMREVGGKTVGMLDKSFKRRKDFLFDTQPELEKIRTAIRTRIKRRLLPEIKKTFQFEVTYLERYLVACYDSESGGFFNPHRDNTTTGTAHRRFACTFNLNAEEYEGGNLRFPEFGMQAYRAPTGGAVVFSCSLLHEATKVTKGKRYAFLPFLYDHEAAKIREQNQSAVHDKVIDLNKGEKFEPEGTTPTDGNL